jgi:cytochrome c-type protein NapB
MKPPPLLLLLGALAGWAVANDPAGAPDSSPAAPAPRFPALKREIPVAPMEDRAFWGAPPPVPHRVYSERDSGACLECHALKKRVGLGQRDTAPVPHAEFSQCLQCHVKGYDGRFEKPWVENTFVGLAPPGKGSRATPVSPPTVPHRVFLREHCLSCHGPKGDLPLQTTHPERSQCLQCHVPEAALDYTRPLPMAPPPPEAADSD